LASILGYNSKTDQGNQDLLYTFTNTANWRQTIADDHSINLLAGQEFTKDKFYSYLLTGRGFPSASLTTLENAGTPTAASNSRSEWALISYFANATYDFRKKYYLNLSGRRDGSSRFGANNRFANFWAVGASWDIKKENFFKVDQINSLRLKASIGTAGNFNIGNYDALGTYALSNKYFDLPSATPFRLPNPDLTWEENKNFDIGLEFSALNSRITGSLDYYNRKTQNLLYPVNVSATTGFSSYVGNVGSLRNKGIEILLSGDVIRTKNLRWTVSVNYSNNDNKILELYSDNATTANSGNLNRLKVGEIANTYYMVKWAGINPANGKNQFYNIDGTVTETYSSGQSQLFSGKSPLVKYFGSIGTELNYKSFDLSAQLYYSGGNYIMNYMYQIGANDGETKNIPQFTDVFNYWKKPGDQTYFANPLDASQNVTFDTDKYLEKGDYITLRDVTLGYTMDNKTVARLKYIKGLRIYAQATNLWLGTKFRGLPEVGESNRESTTLVVPGAVTLYAYPQIKALTFGVDVKF
jgi:TonB-linked SusC/RagA family outer membrane protein